MAAEDRQTTQAADPVSKRTLSLLVEVLADCRPRDFAIRLWDGTGWEAETGQPTRFTLVLNHPGALRAMLSSLSDVGLAEAYIYEDIDIEGDLEQALKLVDYFLQGQQGGRLDRVRHARHVLSLPSGQGWRSERRRRSSHQPAQVPSSRRRAERERQGSSYHYDVSNEFFALHLDRRMTYSCALYDRHDEPLDAAQERKLEYICRKLGLRSGDRLLDIGCGWGSLITYAAQHFDVQAVGVTLSEVQAAWARERVRDLGLSDRCRVEVCNYRELDQPGGYDKVASIEMFEHIEDEVLLDYFESVRQLLRPGGLFLNQANALSVGHSSTWGKPFLQAHIFPVGTLRGLSTTVEAAESAGLEVRDVESLREHYILTTREWLRRLETRHEEEARLTDEATYRARRLYLAGSARGFATNRLNVYQILFSNSGREASELPMPRVHRYV